MNDEVTKRAADGPAVLQFFAFSIRASSCHVLRHPRPSRPAGVRRRPRRGDCPGTRGRRGRRSCVRPFPPIRAGPWSNWPSSTICWRPWASIPTRRPKPRPAIGSESWPWPAIRASWPWARRGWTATGISLPLTLQQEYLDRHLRLAQQRDLPVILHCRDAAGRSAADAPRGRGPRAASRRAARLQRRRGLGGRVPRPGAAHQLRRQRDLLEQEVRAAPGRRPMRSPTTGC